MASLLENNEFLFDLDPGFNVLLEGQAYIFSNGQRNAILTQPDSILRKINKIRQMTQRQEHSEVILNDI